MSLGKVGRWVLGWGMGHAHLGAAVFLVRRCSCCPGASLLQGSGQTCHHATADRTEWRTSPGVAGGDSAHKDCVLGGGVGWGRFVHAYQCNFSFCSNPQQNPNTCGWGMCIASLAILCFWSFGVVLWPQSLGCSPPLPSSAPSHPSPVCPLHPQSPDCLPASPHVGLCRHSTESPLAGRHEKRGMLFQAPSPSCRVGHSPRKATLHDVCVVAFSVSPDCDLVGQGSLNEPSHLGFPCQSPNEFSQLRCRQVTDST